MEKYPHKKFLEDNKEEIAQMPMPRDLQKRMIGFDEMLEDLPHTVGEDHENMEETLEHLSHELLEDLEDHYGHLLENNELPEEHEEPKHREDRSEPNEIKHIDAPEQVVQEGEPLFREEVIHHPEDAHDEPELPHERFEEKEHELEQHDVHSEGHIEHKATEETDEKILHGLHAANYLKVSPQELRVMGFKGTLHKRLVGVGKFCLKRGKYEACYTIYLNS